MHHHKLHICFIGSRTYALYNKNVTGISITGVDVQLFNWANGFSNEKHFDVSVVVGDYGQKKRETYAGVKVWKSNKPGHSGLLRGLLHSIKLFKLLRRINADIYVTRGPSGPLPLQTSMFCKLFRKKFIHMICSDSDVNGSYDKNHAFLGLSHRIALKIADLVVVQNDFQYSILQRRIHNLLQLNNAFPIPPKINKRLDRKYILWVAQSHAIKRPHLYVDIAKSLPDCPFIMILQQYNNVIFNTIINKSATIPNLTIIPGVSFHDINEYYRKAKVFVNTSQAEGFPNTFIQCMINGVPIVSLLVNPNNVITKQRLGFVCNDNMNELKSNIVTLFNDNELYEEYANNCITTAKKQYDIRKNIPIFKNAISNLYSLTQ